MRYFIISDIHANLDALDAVLAAAAAIGYDRTLVLGDLVGYGAQPNEAVERIRSLVPFAIIRGNHDKVAAGLEESEGFNPIAQESARWTHRTLTEANRTYLSSCPSGPLILADGIEICHGSPDDEDAYITSESLALRALRQATAPVCFYGHTHIPVAFELSADGFVWAGGDGDAEGELALRPEATYLINPGSVGQPRDGDPRAAFVIYNSASRRLSRYRVVYPVQQAQVRIEQAGLPPALARRLSLGR
jgi:diadenosine tetraphosphatase ApaH/serine/threonine PP2A family protein phosphatase